MRSSPYSPRHLKEVQKDLDACMRHVREILGKKEKSRQKRRGLLSRLFEWFS